MCQICDVLGAREIIVPKEFSAKIKHKIQDEIEAPILERIKENIKYRLGNAIEFSSTSSKSQLNDAIDALFNRDYKGKKQIFVPEPFLTKVICWGLLTTAMAVHNKYTGKEIGKTHLCALFGCSVTKVN